MAAVEIRLGETHEQIEQDTEAQQPRLVFVDQSAQGENWVHLHSPGHEPTKFRVRGPFEIILYSGQAHDPSDTSPEHHKSATVPAAEHNARKVADNAASTDSAPQSVGAEAHPLRSHPVTVDAEHDQSAPESSSKVFASTEYTSAEGRHPPRKDPPRGSSHEDMPSSPKQVKFASDHPRREAKRPTKEDAPNSTATADYDENTRVLAQRARSLLQRVGEQRDLTWPEEQLRQELGALEEVMWNARVKKRREDQHAAMEGAHAPDVSGAFRVGGNNGEPSSGGRNDHRPRGDARSPTNRVSQASTHYGGAADGEPQYDANPVDGGLPDTYVNPPYPQQDYGYGPPNHAPSYAFDASDNTDSPTGGVPILYDSRPAPMPDSGYGPPNRAGFYVVDPGRGPHDYRRVLRNHVPRNDLRSRYYGQQFYY